MTMPRYPIVVDEVQAEEEKKTEETYENVPPPPFIQIAFDEGWLYGLDAQGKVWQMEWYDAEAEFKGRGRDGDPSHWNRLDVPARVKVRLG